MKKIKGRKTLAILKKLAEGAVEAGELFVAYSSAGYGASLWKIERQKEKIRSARVRLEQEIRERQNFYSLLHKLKKQDLVNKTKTGDKLYITKRGELRKGALEKRELTKSLPDTNYPKLRTDSWILVTFDVPEKDRHKRNWFRATLISLDFKLVQKSVFIGRTKIPQELLDDLQDLKLMKHIEILEIKRTGTLKEIE